MEISTSISISGDPILIVSDGYKLGGQSDSGAVLYECPDHFLFQPMSTPLYYGLDSVTYEKPLIFSSVVYSLSPGPEVLPKCSWCHRNLSPYEPTIVRKFEIQRTDRVSLRLHHSECDKCYLVKISKGGTSSILSGKVPSLSGIIPKELSIFMNDELSDFCAVMSSQKSLVCTFCFAPFKRKEEVVIRTLAFSSHIYVQIHHQRCDVVCVRARTSEDD